MSTHLTPPGETEGQQTVGSSGALTPADRSQFMPAMSIESAVERFNTLVEFVSRVLRKDVDYGVIPGTGKPTLLKPGAEKLTTFFGLSTRFQLIERIEDWSGTDHSDEPFFYYMYRCQLSRGDLLIAESDGSCNSRESKYRYREAQRICPECKQAAIIKGKEEYGGGWICFKKKGGCGAKFAGGDQKIEGQPSGRTPNPEIADQVNTIQKMAQKRCLSGSTPIVIKTSRGISRTKIETLATIFENGNEQILVPGIHNDWRLVKAVCKSTSRRVKRINLRDGSHILATENHRFPTKRGLKSVEELKPDDVFIHSQVPLTEETEAMPEIGWVAGLYLAEGGIHKQGDAVSIRFTLHENETEYIHKVVNLAERLGATWNITEKKGHCVTLNVHGRGFAGLVGDFVAGENSWGKHFSKRAFNQGGKFLRAMLDGYSSGDGCWTERQGRRSHWRIGFTGENRELAKDLRTVCAMLNLRLSLKRSTAKCQGIEYPTYVGWIKETYESYDQCELFGIESIEDERQLCTVYDIEVDDDHLFLLGNGIQTHNSLIAACLLAVNASEFFTQDVEDMMISSSSIAEVATIDEVSPVPATTTYEAPPLRTERASAEDSSVNIVAEHAHLNREILTVCHSLGKTEGQLLDWLKKKYSVDAIDNLAAFQKREVLAFLQSKRLQQAP